MFSILSRRCPLLATSCPSFFCLLSMLSSDSRFDLVWFRLSCDHGWIRSGSVNVRKQQQQQHSPEKKTYSWKVGIEPSSTPLLGFQGSRGSRKNKKYHRSFVHCSSYIPYLPNMCVEGFLWVGSRGVLSTAGSLLLRDCQKASESAALPHGVCGR